ncbi:MAG: DeoR/GlpR transcriptional regulator [Lacrimispora celerecrescens]|nr:DeoR/GlpR transcriptional regulator [Lacrimispora celerecrescens]
MSTNEQPWEKMSKSQREEEILEILKLNNYATVDYLAEKLFISPSSIRRDLSNLESKGYVRRSYGGVTLISQPATIAPFSFRRQENRKEKMAIVKNAVKLITPDSSIFIDSSTTALNFAFLLNPSLNTTVYTNNMQLAHHLASKHIKTYAAGGLVSDFDNVVTTGSYTLGMLENIYVDQMFFTCTALSPGGQIMDVNEEETVVRKFMLARAQKRVFLCIKERFGQFSQHMAATLDDVEYVVSDEKLPDEFTEKFKHVHFISSDNNGSTERGETVDYPATD